MSDMYGQTEKALSKGADYVDQARGDVKNKCGVLSGQIQTLMAGWGGQGATAFNNLMISWDQKQETILKALDQLSASMKETERDNVSTDESQSATHANLQGRLGGRRAPHRLRRSMMSFDGIKVQHGHLDAGAADVMKAAKDIEARLDQLETELNPLRSDWNGNAKMAYDQAKAKWDQAMQEMTLRLQQASQGVDASNAEYKAADARGANRF